MQNRVRDRVRGLDVHVLPPAKFTVCGVLCGVVVFTPSLVITSKLNGHVPFFEERVRDDM